MVDILKKCSDPTILMFSFYKNNLKSIEQWVNVVERVECLRIFTAIIADLLALFAMCLWVELGLVRYVKSTGFFERALEMKQKKTNVNIQLDYWQTIGLFPRSSPKNQHNFPFDHTMVLFGLKNRMQSWFN